MNLMQKVQPWSVGKVISGHVFATNFPTSENAAGVPAESQSNEGLLRCATFHAEEDCRPERREGSHEEPTVRFLAGEDS